ncbi:MAG: hypothetical protein ACRDG3_03495 [Tepidiformaceae bacterium]
MSGGSPGDAQEASKGRHIHVDGDPDSPDGHGRRRRARMHGIPGRAPRWEAVWEGSGEAQASVVGGGLEASGIRTQVTSSRVAAQPFTHQFWFVMVPLRQAEAARHLLRDRGEAHRVVTGDDDTSADQIATLKFVAVALLAAVVIGLLIAIRTAGS